MVYIEWIHWVLIVVDERVPHEKQGAIYKSFDILEKTSFHIKDQESECYTEEISKNNFWKEGGIQSIKRED